MDEIKLVEPEMVEHCTTEPILLEEVPLYLDLGKRMIDFCNSNGAIGLSAPQIGVYKKMFVYRKTQNLYQIIFNPSYIKVSKRPIKVLEGCMTYKDKNFLVKRSKEIQAIFDVPEKGKLIRKGMPLTGDKSIIFQHECDHVNGITIKTCGVPQVGQE